jgi:hypothetical protein
VVRLERAYQGGKHLIDSLQRESTHAALLLLFGALSIFAAIYDVIESTAEGSELGAWVVLCVAISAGIWSLCKFISHQWRTWRQADREARMWASMLTDHRVVADLRWAQSRSN